MLGRVTLSTRLWQTTMLGRVTLSAWLWQDCQARHSNIIGMALTEQMNTTKSLTTYCLLQTAAAGDLWGKFSLHRETHHQPFQVNHATEQPSAHWNPRLALAASCKCPDRGSDRGCLEAAVTILFRLQYYCIYLKLNAAKSSDYIMYNDKVRCE